MLEYEHAQLVHYTQHWGDCYLWYKFPCCLLSVHLVLCVMALLHICSTVKHVSITTVIVQILFNDYCGSEEGS